MRGLGVKLNLRVADLASAYRSCRAAGCTITSEPREEFWGERVFTFLDPFGYEWELAELVVPLSPQQMAEAGATAWNDGTRP